MVETRKFVDAKQCFSLVYEGSYDQKIALLVIIKNLRGNCCIFYLCYFDQVVILSHRMMYIYLHVTLHSLDHQQTILN